MIFGWNEPTARVRQDSLVDEEESARAAGSDSATAGRAGSEERSRTGGDRTGRGGLVLRRVPGEIWHRRLQFCQVHRRERGHLRQVLATSHQHQPTGEQ